MAKNTVHVVKHGDGWAAKTSGSSRAAGVYKTQSEAIQKGHQMAENQKTQFMIHGRNGQIRKSSSFGNDPFPPKDRT